jgi:hypothetical protein
VIPTKRDRQVRRALAAERARQRRDVDAEVAMYRRYVKRALPWVAALNVAMIVFLISRGMAYAIAGNVAVLPILWLSWVMVTIADARDSEQRARRAWAAVSDEHADALEREVLRDGPTDHHHHAPADCVYTDADECVICGERHPLAPPVEPPEDDIPF